MDVRNQYAYLKPQPLVWLAILGSAALHGLLVLALVIGGIVKENAKPLKQRAIITRILKKGKKRPKNQLPHKDVKVKPAARPPAPIPSPKAAKTPTAKPSKPAPAKAPRRKDYTRSMSSALAALADDSKKSDYENDGDPDGAEDGDSLIASKGRVYETKVYKAIKAQYSVPELIKPSERMFLNATVVITLNASGHIKDFSFEKRSGKDVFDSAIENAVRRAAPFPAPPSELADRYSSVGIGINFRASKM